MHVRNSLLVGVTAATLLVTACSSGDDDPTTLPAVSPSETSATPTAIPVPEAAQAHTEEGAVAFVEHYYDAAEQGYRGNDVEAGVAALRDGSEPTMRGMQRLDRLVESTWLAGGTVRGRRRHNASIWLLAPGTFDADMAFSSVAVPMPRRNDRIAPTGRSTPSLRVNKPATLRFDVSWADRAGCDEGHPVSMIVRLGAVPQAAHAYCCRGACTRDATHVAEATAVVLRGALHRLRCPVTDARER